MRSTPGGDEHRSHGLLYGERVAAPPEEQRGAPPSAAGTEPDASAERIAAASLIVAGTVSAVSVAAQSADRPITRHDPIWKKALIQVEATVKGTLPGDTVEVLFPASTDVRWHLAPKFREGQQGIWVLHRTDIAELGTSAYTALDPQDVQPRDRLDSIRAVVSTRGGE